MEGGDCAMKKMLYLLAVISIIITGCSKEEDPVSEEPGIEEHSNIAGQPEKQPQEPHVFKANPSTFHFVADWLNDTQVLYVEKIDGLYKVNYFDMETGKTGLVYEDDTFIIDVFIHPTRDYLLVHTSEHPNSAVMKIVRMDGTVLHQLEIDSTELAIEWNPENPEKILFTAFYEDWTFDLFFFDGHDDRLSIVELEDPFPKWAGDNTIVSMLYQEHPLDGGDIQLYHLDTGEIETIGIGNVIYFDMFKDTIIVVQSIDADDFSYTIRQLDGTIISGWTLPAVSNYSEWIVPTIEWLDEDRILVKGAEKSGQLDEMADGFNLYLFQKENPEIIMKDLEAGPIKCSPSGQYCLSGYTSDELIDVEAKEIRKWIELGK
jgi:hypothetical protein